MSQWRILTGDVREQLRTLDAGSVQTCVTSPPYFGLRDYGHAGQIGLEPTPETYVAALVAVFAEVRRVLADDGTVWLNLGDSYSSGGRGSYDEASDNKGTHGTPRPSRTRGSQLPAGFHEGVRQAGNVGRAWVKPPVGFKPKDLLGIPWRVAFALQADGWYLRQDIIWSKPNPMPESVTDRCTKAHEYIFLLSKSARYYFDAEAMQEPLAESTVTDRAGRRRGAIRGVGVGSNTNRRDGGVACGESGESRNKRSVWTVTTQPYPEAHFATYPEKLIEPCILAGSREGDTVLDPFNGSGTTGVVAIGHRRNYVGIELNPAYVELARKRIRAVNPLFAWEATA